MIEAVIFDMDGVIIDSEPLWAEAQREVFTAIGVDYDEELALKTVGTGSFDTIDFWYRRQPWEGISFKEVEERIYVRMIELIKSKGAIMEGLTDLIGYFKSKGLRIALASGSPLAIIHLVLDKFGIKDQFEMIQSIENVDFGKPHPAVFISVANHFEIVPMNIIVIEDSFNGLIAAKAARMKAIAYLPNGQYKDTRFDFADLKLSSYKEFNDTYYNYLQNLV